ncbi:phage transcriptional regulator, AlpA [Sphingomonas sp. LH128]|uniref:helix-turn-helix transcriptional regulator n=1 Tax=Sphingomonas sp. LH128 TaxID=473781 RepID=UPI00027CC949|nr:helix-turn-helix domain-containing protein [Sphingomonas sp. LH128]EJU14238.1 phage transcriptional regulator, AlpA [Sphingomonas sp. LH128]
MLKPNKLRRPFAQAYASSPPAELAVPAVARPAPSEPDPVEIALAPMIAEASLTVPALLTPAQTGEVLGVGVKTLERWRSEGTGPRFVKLSPGTVRYRALDLNVFIAERIKSNTLQ